MDSTPPISNAPLPKRLVRPLEEFLSTETLGGLLLVAAAIVALIWANLPSSSYVDFWSTHIAISVGDHTLELTLVEWVNDALMAIFFFVVGLEIKREVVRGELADRRKAMLPVAAALGGMIAPALIYVSLNAGTGGAEDLGGGEEGVALGHAGEGLDEGADDALVAFEEGIARSLDVLARRRVGQFLGLVDVDLEQISDVLRPRLVAVLAGLFPIVVE